MIRFVKHPDISMMGGKELRWWSSGNSFNNDVYDFERYLDVADIAVSDILHSIRWVNQCIIAMHVIQLSPIVLVLVHNNVFIISNYTLFCFILSR